MRYPDVERQSFFTTPGDFENKLSGHGPNLVYGDMNARLYNRLPGEDGVLDQHLLQGDKAAIRDETNSHLLVEFCIPSAMLVATTLLDVPLENQITCCNVDLQPMDVVSWKSHYQIDFLS